MPSSGPDIFQLLFLIFMEQIDLFVSFVKVNLNHTSETLKGLKQGQSWHRFPEAGQISSCVLCIIP